jgi:hypothetical protein
VKLPCKKQVQNKFKATFFIKPITSLTLSIKESKISYHVVAGAFEQKATQKA